MTISQILILVSEANIISEAVLTYLKVDRERISKIIKDYQQEVQLKGILVVDMVPKNIEHVDNLYNFRNPLSINF